MRRPPNTDLLSGERQVAPDISGIRRDHVCRYQWAKKRLKSAKTILDFGCGVGYGSSILADGKCEVLAVDRSEASILYAREHYLKDNLVFDISDDANFISTHEGEVWDGAVLFEIIEHLRNPIPLLKFLSARVKKLLCSVPNEKHFPWRGQTFHFHHYHINEFIALLEHCGFAIDMVRGQRDHVSDVKDVEGRTIVIEASSDLKASTPSTWTQSAFDLDQARATAPAHVALLGMGPSLAKYVEIVKVSGGKTAYSSAVWGINSTIEVFGADLGFHMDDVRIQQSRAQRAPRSNIAVMCKWLENWQKPVLTSIVPHGWENSCLQAFPLETMMNHFDRELTGVPYFNNTGAYAIAYAAMIGVKRLSLFGMDYTMPNAHTAEAGRACCEFWIGVGTAHGMDVNIPEQSSLMDACASDRHRVYGYDMTDVHIFADDDGVAIRFNETENPPDAETIEKRYDHSRHPNPLMNGGHS